MGKAQRLEKVQDISNKLHSEGIIGEVTHSEIVNLVDDYWGTWERMLKDI